MKSQQDTKLHCSHYLTARTRLISRKCLPSSELITNFRSLKNTRILAQTPTQDCRTNSSLSFNQNHFAVFGGRPAHWLSTLKSMLPLLNELRRLPQVLGLVALAVRHATRQAVRGSGRGLQGFTQGTNSVIDVAFGPGVLVRDASCSLPVGRHIFLYLRGLALYFECSLQRLLLHRRIFLHELHVGCKLP